jgi:hypothetical protein
LLELALRADVLVGLQDHGRHYLLVEGGGPIVARQRIEDAQMPNRKADQPPGGKRAAEHLAPRAALSSPVRDRRIQPGSREFQISEVVRAA